MNGNPDEDHNSMNIDPITQNEAFLKHHKEINLNGNVYCGETVERIEQYCGCEVICIPHFNGISFYVKNEHYPSAQAILEKIYENDKKEIERKTRTAIRKVEAEKKVRQKFEERMARCRQPDNNERKFLEGCLKTLKIEDYVQTPDAETYRALYKKYPEYFKLVGWPEDVEGSAAKRYLNSSLIKKI